MYIIIAHNHKKHYIRSETEVGPIGEKYLLDFEILRTPMRFSIPASEGVLQANRHEF
jgi:hypothetical protein